MTLRTYLTSPLTVLASVATVIAHLLDVIPAFINAVWVTSPTWYPVVAISASTLAPQLGTVVVPFVGVVDVVAVAQGAAIGGAVILVARLGDRAIERFTKHYRENQ